MQRQWALVRPDLVHIATEGPLGWSALQTARRLGLPVCSDFRTNFHAYSGHYGIGWLERPIAAYLRWFHNRCATTMVPTERLRQELAQRGFQRLVVVPRGVDTLRFDPARRCEALRREWGANASDPVVLCVGRLAPEKNLQLLVRAFCAMRQRRPGMRLVLVGDGPARASLQRAVPDAVFAGTLAREALARHYASADVFVFPSMTETYGNVTAEALASGLPVVAYDHAAAAVLVQDGDNGYLAPLGDEVAFVQQALRIVAEPSSHARMAPRARASACRCSWGQVIDQIEAVFLAAQRVSGAVDRPAGGTSVARRHAAPGPYHPDVKESR
jgi:glycosyltransferase involved in cell wall biosynthesis